MTNNKTSSSAKLMFLEHVCVCVWLCVIVCLCVCVCVSVCVCVCVSKRVKIQFMSRIIWAAGKSTFHFFFHPASRFDPTVIQ